MSHAKTDNDPEQKKDAVIIPNVIRQSLNQNCQNTAENAHTDQFIGTAHRVFTKAQRKLRKQKYEDTEKQQCKNTHLRNDLQI